MTTSVSHPAWCLPSRCSTATIDPAVGPVVLEHAGQPVEVVTSEGKFSLQRILEPGTNGSEFVRLAAGLHDADDQVLIHVSASDAQDLAELLRSVAEQIVGQR